MQSRIRVLVATGDATELPLISALLEELGHEVIHAGSGSDAVRHFQSESPDMVLVDIDAPDPSSFESIARIREIGGSWVPIVCLAARDHGLGQARCIDAGGDDFICRPIEAAIFKARIGTFARIAWMQRRITQSSEELDQFRDENQRELLLAKHLIEKITRHNHFDHQRIQHYNQPAQHFSGDIFLAAFTPTDEIHLLLADGTGHGLAAAINVLPVVEIFYGMTAKGFAIHSIAHELNRKIKLLMPIERFVAATLVSINLNEATLNIWNGGNPPALFVDDKGSIRRGWKSTHPALGILGTPEFDATTEVYNWKTPGRLYLYSDGLIEAQNRDGKEFGTDGLEQALRRAPAELGCAELLDALEQHMDGLAAHDDVTIAVIECPTQAPDKAPKAVSGSASGSQPGEKIPGRWKIALRLSAAELTRIEVVPMLLGWIDQFQLDHKHRGAAFLIFTELFNNALDHGILKLDSALKYTPDGFEHYVNERRQRLAHLQQGVLEIEVERVRHQEHELLIFHLKDSGNGFDFEEILRQDIATNLRPSGRGLALINTLCTKIEFAGNGSEVTVSYALT